MDICTTPPHEPEIHQELDDPPGQNPNSTVSLPPPPPLPAVAEVKPPLPPLPPIPVEEPATPGIGWGVLPVAVGFLIE